MIFWFLNSTMSLLDIRCGLWAPSDVMLEEQCRVAERYRFTYVIKAITTLITKRVLLAPTKLLSKSPCG